MPSIDATFLIAVPMIFAVVLALAPLSRGTAAYIATLVSLAVAGAVAGLAYRFDLEGGVQFATNREWIGELGIRYHVGIDGLSLVMVAVTALVMACAIGYAAWEASTTDAVETGSAGRPRETAPVEGGERVLAVPSAEGGGRPVGGTWTIRPGGPYGGGRSRMYFALLLLLEGALLLLFTAQDLIVFYVGFEAMLIPLYFLMGVWGGPGRTQATLKFIIYTVGGSLLMLVGMIALALGHEGGPTFAIAELGGNGSTWIFLSFLIAFAIKSPLWPFHGWLPDAYRQSPPEVAAILSGLASKAGAYGLLRLVLPLFPGPVADWRGPIIVLATIGLLYGSILAFRQPDARGVIAYSSIAQMGLILVGIFVLNDRGASGAAFQMVNHAILSCALFLLAGWLATQTGAETFDRLGGLARGRPILASTVLVAGVATLAVPGSATFASEFLILLGAFEESAILGAIASLAIVLAAMYMLRWISAVLHESRGSAVAATAGPSDLVSGGLLAIVPLVLAILALSFYPFAVTERIDPVTTSLPSPAAAEAAR